VGKGGVMIEELKTKIDGKITELNLTEKNLWRIYEECKKIMRDYEFSFTKGFEPSEYHEYIKYITDKLGI
jgi:hypothetical protein